MARKFAALALACVALALAATAASAARSTPEVIATLHSEGFPHGLRGVESRLSDILGRGKKHDADTMRGYMSIRFSVPPAEARDFEDAWIKMEDECDKKEKNMDMMALHKTKMDNLFYISYGEWATCSHMQDHMTSDHFKDFAKYVDDAGIRWEMQLLQNMSEDVEEELMKGQSRKEVMKARHKDATHILVQYHVTPGHANKFMDAWTDTAYDTMKSEKGCRMLNLRKVATDNTRFWAYNMWDSMNDWMQHVESKHVGRFKGQLEDIDTVYFITPLELVSCCHEGGQ